MDHDEPGGDDRSCEESHDERGVPRSPAGNASPGGLGGGDFASLLGDPGPGEDEGRVRLRCPDPTCDQTGTAADYRAAYWPRCERHLRRMVLVEAG
jgi:hypothetical protein